MIIRIFFHFKIHMAGIGRDNGGEATGSFIYNYGDVFLRCIEYNRSSRPTNQKVRDYRLGAR